MLKYSIPNPLPQEICELCIDALEDTAKNDKLSRTALIQCLRVSRVFWMRARRHIFSDIRIQREVMGSRTSVEDQLVGLLAMMTSNGVKLPFSVAKLIKSFTLNVIHEPDDQQLTIIKSRSLAEILQECVETQVLNHLHLIAMPSPWIRIDSSIQESLHALSRTPGFKVLYLFGIQCISINVLEGSTIKELALDQVRLGPPIPGTPSAQGLNVDTLLCPPELELLKANDIVCNQQASLPSSHIDIVLPFSRLGKLISIICEPRNLAATEILAVRSHRCLHTLHLIFLAYGFLNGFVPIDLKKLLKLRHLKLVLMQTIGDIDAIGTLHPLIPSTSALQSLTVEISLVMRSSICTDSEHWKTFKKALIQSRIPKVELIFNLSALVRENRPSLIESASKKLTAIFASLHLHTEEFRLKLNIFNTSSEIMDTMTDRFFSL